MRERASSPPCCPWSRRRADGDARSRQSHSAPREANTRPRSSPTRPRSARARPRRALDPQALDDAALHEVLVDDLVDVGLVDVGVPDPLGIDHDDRAFLAAIEAAGGVYTHLSRAAQLQLLHALLGVFAHALRVVAGAARQEARE